MLVVLSSNSVGSLGFAVGVLDLLCCCLLWLVAVRCCLVLFGVLLFGVVGCCGVLLGVVVCCVVLLGVVWCCWVLLGVLVGCGRVLVGTGVVGIARVPV